MKRFLVIILALSVVGSAQAQQANTLTKDSQPQQPAVILPPVIVSANTTTPAPSAPPANETAEKNHSSLVKAEAEAAIPARPLAAATETYRVGPGDVLDVRLLNFSSKQSSLFTVQPNGTVEYPYLSEPVQVSGLTAEAIAARLNSLIKVFDQPQTVVNIRHYTSHAINVSGLASKLGPQALQREAVPLFVLLPLLQPLPEAQRAAIIRNGQPLRVLALTQPEELNFLLEAGDEISFLPAAPLPLVKKEFFYIIGTVNTPGQKEFHNGLTLTQAIFASGGLTKGRDAKIRVLRQAADGRLTPAEYSLKRISQGKDPDPALQAGDRLEVFNKD